jgi:Zn-dependent protease/predicted transcriptional regulator
VARIGGIDIEVHPSWLLILGFLAWSLSDGVFPDQYSGWSTATYWIVGTAAAFLLFVTVLIHEMAHAFVAIRRGLPVPKITLFIFGGVSHLSRQPKTAGEEFAIAFAGPLTSVIIAIVTFAAWFGLRHVNEQLGAIAIYLATVNLLLAVFNILPGFPLDGGRVQRSIAWNRTKSFRKATRIAGSVGELFGYALMVGGAALLLSGYALNGLWFMFIGWFLTGAARNEKQALQLDSILGGLKARNVMRDTYPTVLPGISVQEVVDRHMVGEGERAAVVARDGAVLGILSVTDVRHLSRDDWSNTPVQGIMTPREKVVTVTADTPALDVLHLLGERRLNQVPVLEDGRMIGLITRREIIERLQLAESLGADRHDGTSGDGTGSGAAPAA